MQGTLIGGPTLFYGSYEFYAYRADITGLGLVEPGSNTFTVADFDFVGGNDENSGASILVIYDDGTAADLSLRDGLDMAYFGFVPTLDATVPQVFEVNPENVDRTADLLLLVASVGENRPTTVQVTTSAGDQIFENVLGSTDGDAWDSLTLTVDVPAGADELSVQVDFHSRRGSAGGLPRLGGRRPGPGARGSGDVRRRRHRLRGRQP